jgi:polyhydroxyalkanoate synthesis regulator phasin
MGVTPPAPAAEPKRDGVASADEAEKLREEVSALRDRLRSLEERLQKRKAESK